MRRHADFSAMLAEVLARSLDEAGVPHAVLGFSTASWNGGRAQRDWRRAGRPAAPGRVAERLHLVFADGDRPWRRSRLDLAALLAPDLLPRGTGRRGGRVGPGPHAGGEDRRRIVLVLSDGGPAESATSAADYTANLLDRHLTGVVESAARHGCEVYGLGLGRDLSAFYPRSTVLAADPLPSPATFREILALLRR